MVALEYLFCYAGRGPIPGHLKLYGMNTDVYGQIPIGAYVVYLAFGYSRLKALQDEIPFGRILFGAHLLCVAAVLSITLATQKGLVWPPFDPFSYAKSAVYMLGTVLLALACVPLRSWFGAIRATGRLWLYALLAGVAGWYIGSPIKFLWRVTSTVQSGFMQRATLHAVKAVLGIFLPNLIVDPVSFTIGTPQYSIMIVGGCSGIEGLGLVLVFTSIWLWYFRKEYRFPQALLLVPCALGCIWILNIVRLCALILISNAGGSLEVVTGFHIQAGWIAFTLVGLGFSFASQRIPWVHRIPGAPPGPAADPLKVGLETGKDVHEELNVQRGESPAIRAYLLPFLAILAATFISKAASGRFEWLYPLRFFAAAIVLFCFLPELKKLNWRFGWFGPFAGAAVFLMWIAPSAFALFGPAHTRAASTLGADLAALSPFARWAWIAIRVAAAVFTVPIAEELAFRGYLARRLMSRDFVSVPFSSLTLLSIGLSSAVFGMEHMKNLLDWRHLLLGTLAGLAFAAALRWRGRIGDAVAAHAVSNLLLAAWVLGMGDWAQW
jgi:exosortase E/protease (VPEID-CTERM system)